MTLRVGRVCGVDFYLHPLLGMALALFFLAGLGNKVILALVALVSHEAAHALVAVKLECSVRKIEFLPFGGVAVVDGLQDTDVIRELVIAAAGPLASFLLAGASYLAGAHHSISPEWLKFFLEINLSLALFNLLPGLPLDGGRMLRAALALSTGYGRATELVFSVTRLLCVGLLGIFVAGLAQGGSVNLTIFLAAWFMYRAAKQEILFAKLEAMRRLAVKKDRLWRRGILPLYQFIALDSMLLREAITVFRPEAYHSVLIVDRNFMKQGVLTEAEIWTAIERQGLLISFKQILKSE